MQAILFYEETDPTQLSVAAYEEGVFKWREKVAKNGLDAWLKRHLKEGKIAKGATWIAMLSELSVARRLLLIPTSLGRRERLAMADNALTLALGSRPVLIQMQVIQVQDDGQTLWRIVGAEGAVIDKWQGHFGVFAGRLQWMAAADYLAVVRPVSDGYYSIEAPLWRAVVAVVEGVVIGGRATQDVDLTTLHMTILEETGQFLLSPYLQPWHVDAVKGRFDLELQAWFFQKKPLRKWAAAKGERPFLALSVLCVVLPGLLWLAAQGRTTTMDTQATDTPHADVVTRTSYSTLVSQAYAQKGERIVLLTQEAADGALAIHGRCNEALDLAAYMRALEKTEMALHPLLLDLSKKTDKERYYYEFVVQISLEGREKS